MSNDVDEIWPVDVIERARAGDLVVIVGAGASAAATNSKGHRPPNWEELLRGLVASIGVQGDASARFDALVAGGRLLDAAEYVRFEASKLSRSHNVAQALRRLVDGPQADPFTGGRMYEALLEAGPRTIVTTNYDKILERTSRDAFNKHPYKSQRLGADIRRGEPVLVKLHGSVDEVDDAILSQRDYTRLRLEGSHVLQVLSALLTTRVALFVGYSLRDPDMRLLLENVLGGRGELPAHYMLTDSSMPAYELEILQYSYGVTAITYPPGDYEEAAKMLASLGQYSPSQP